MDPYLRRLCAEKGVFLRSEALELGYDDRTIAILVRSGEWHRVRRGAYTFGDIWEVADERARHAIHARAAYRAAKSDVALSHSSAVLEHTDCYWDLDLSNAHLTRLDGRSGRKEAGVAQHRGLIRQGDVIDVNGVNVMSATRAALELTTMADAERSLVVINGLLNAKKVTAAGLRDRYASMDHWPCTLVTDLVLRLADPRIASVGETRTFWLLRLQGLPCPEPQYKIFDQRGQLVAIVDFAWPAHGAFLEFDGKSKYSKYLREGERPEDVVFREKQREDLVRGITNWRCIRLVWADLSRPQVTGARIRRELGLRRSA